MIFQPAMLYGKNTVPTTSSHVKKVEVKDMKMCRWVCGHTLRGHVRNDDIRERLEVENITESCMQARLRSFNVYTWRYETNNTPEERLWRWYHLGEEKEEDRSRDEWTVSTVT